MAKNKHYIHIICDEEFKESVKNLASDDGLKVSPYIKMLITKKIKERQFKIEADEKRNESIKQHNP